ncbi:MAG: glycoside hydrolase family 3 C-terminal domain-containing protein [Actinomycetota bacterium]|nr:glycoside hydrolase family 3 C-terminal domain-containing protein [Actinomycetota bacterium]
MDSSQAGQELPHRDDAVGQLPLVDQVAMCAGRDLWRVPIPVAGTDLVVTDGPNGARGDSFVGGRSACFPCASALGATFDHELVHAVGSALGVETRRAGAQVLLAPTVNLHRHPLGGRHFECFSEDPELTAQLAVAYIDGLQQEGVGACIKHFVCNDGEFERMSISVEVDEAVLRELYLLPFERAVAAGVWSVMAAYNRLEGTYCSEHPVLLHQVLREEWGFDGVVMSDWFATHSTTDALVAGLDLEMPGPPRYRGEALVAALRTSEVAPADVARAAARVARLAARTGLGARQARRPIAPVESTRKLIRRAASASMVLLKNEQALPLAQGASVALIGPLADRLQYHGGGSAQVNPEHVSPLLPALADALGPASRIALSRGSTLAAWPAPLGPPELAFEGVEGARVRYQHRRAHGALIGEEQARSLQLLWLGEVVPGSANGEVEVVVDAELSPATQGQHQLVLQASGHARVLIDDEVVLECDPPVPAEPSFELSGEEVRAPVVLGAGRPVPLRIEFSPHATPGVIRLQLALVAPDPGDLIEQAARTAASCECAVVVVGSPHGYEREGRDRPSLGLPGDQDALISAVARANPRTVVVLNTGAPVTMPWLDEVAAVVQAWFPGQEAGAALAGLLCGAENFSGRLPTTFFARQRDVPSDPFFPGSGGTVRYGEGFRLGYRAMPGDAALPVLFPFGFGLSYSSFTLGEATATRDETGYRVRVPVTNTAGPAGRAVLQCYLESGEPDRPVLELKAFCTIEVAPGETALAQVSIAREQLRRYRTGRYVPLEGPFRLRIGTSSADLPITLECARP